MGNVSGRKDEGPSGAKEEESEEFMEYAHESMVQSPPQSPRACRSPLMFTPQVPIVPLQRPNEMQLQSNDARQKATRYEAMLLEKGIPTIITWNYDGKQVAVEGSWNHWKTREFLQKSGRDFSIMKVLPSGVYHYRFIVDGQWRYAPDLPQERDDMGNVFNILDLQDHIPEVLDNVSDTESPPSPISSYNNASFSLEDLNEKLPELPPLLRQTPLDRPSSSMNSPMVLEKPLSAVLDHLYIQRGGSGESTVALSSTQRFREKYVTVVLYKSSKK
ncbi:hypothetical protein RJ639_046343, partial [Escallonia herrerae]